LGLYLIEELHFHWGLLDFVDFNHVKVASSPVEENSNARLVVLLLVPAVVDTALLAGICHWLVS